MEYQVTIKDLIRETNAKLIQGDENLVIQNLCRDTRKLNPGEIYLGFKGENFNRKYFLWRSTRKRS